jgi:hypothetical protein
LARVSNQRGRVQFHHGSWSVLYWIRDLSAKGGWRRVRESLNAQSENAAISEAAGILAHINECNQPGRTPSRPPTFKEFIDREWADYLTRRERSLSTLSAYNSNLKLYVLPSLGAKRVHHVTPADISDLRVGGKGQRIEINSQPLRPTASCIRCGAAARFHPSLAGSSEDPPTGQSQEREAGPDC